MLDCWTLLVTRWREGVGADEVHVWQLLATLALVALSAAVVLAPLLQWGYVRRVQRFMGFRELSPPPPAWWERQAQRQGRNSVPPGPAPASLATCMQLRERRIRRATGAAWLVLSGGSLLLLPLQLDMTLAERVVGVLFVAVLALQPALVNLRPEGSKWVLLAAMAAVSGLLLWMDKQLDGGDFLGALVTVLLPYLVSVQRTRRALVVPLAVLSAGLCVSVVLALAAIVPAQCSDPQARTLGGSWLLLGGVLAGMLGGFSIGLWVTFRALDALAGLIARGWLSDLSLVALSGVLLVTGLMTLTVDHTRVSLGLKLLLWASWSALALCTYVAVLRAHPLPQHGRRLLMLRVFSKDSRAEALLDTLQARWQLAGPVMEIGGPDLVKLNLSIHEVIAFLNFRLHELFQPAAVPAEVLACSLDLGLDREGRFRVNELFCFDTSWKAVVEQLLGLADVVLLDLRGFNPSRGGTAHEVERLAERGLLPRVVVVHDDSTDWDFFDARVAGRGPAGQALALKVDARERQALTQCLQGLLAVAETPPPASA